MRKKGIAYTFGINQQDIYSATTISAKREGWTQFNVVENAFHKVYNNDISVDSMGVVINNIIDGNDRFVMTIEVKAFLTQLEAFIKEDAEPPDSITLELVYLMSDNDSADSMSYTMRKQKEVAVEVDKHPTAKELDKMAEGKPQHIFGMMDTLDGFVCVGMDLGDKDITLTFRKKAKEEVGKDGMRWEIVDGLDWDQIHGD